MSPQRTEQSATEQSTLITSRTMIMKKDQWMKSKWKVTLLIPDTQKQFHSTS